MPEEKKHTVLQEQQKSKPEIEGFISQYLDENLSKVALDFVVWLRKNMIPPHWGSSINTWTSTCKGKAICKMQIQMFNEPGSGIHRGYIDDRPGGLPCLVIIPFLTNMESYKASIMSERLQDFIWDNANSCVYSKRSPTFRMKKAPGCKPGKPCAPGRDVTVLGRVIKYNCSGCFVMSLWNPNEATIKSIKRLLELEKIARSDISRIK